MSIVSVFCASSPNIDEVYFKDTAILGQLLAKQEFSVVCGAGSTGLMGCITDSMISQGGTVIGIIPQFMFDLGWQHKELSKLIVVGTMHERKAMMAQMSNATIALPGGCGTFEELLEIITWRQLGLYQNPVIILNTNGYYNHLIKLLDEAVGQKFMSESNLSLWTVVQNPQEVINCLTNNDIK
jgi:uncharacterized protein (TIGR00730 family)